MNKIARIVASKWFAGPLCVAPLFFLSWNYFQALGQLDQGPGNPEEVDMNDEQEMKVLLANAISPKRLTKTSDGKLSLNGSLYTGWYGEFDLEFGYLKNGKGILFTQKTDGRVLQQRKKVGDEFCWTCYKSDTGRKSNEHFYDEDDKMLRGKSWSPDGELVSEIKYGRGTRTIFIGDVPAEQKFVNGEAVSDNLMEPAATGMLNKIADLLILGERPPSSKRTGTAFTIRDLDANRTFTDTTVTDVEYADFSFTVSDEDFHEYTGGTFRKTEESSTEDKDAEENFSFTVSDEQFDSATEALSLQEGGDQDAFVARKMAESSNQVIAGANINERFLHETGNVAIAFFLIVLCFTPLKRIFSRAKLVSALNRHRRLVGLTAFFYAVLHLILYFDDGLNRLFDEWYLFYIQCGLASFVTLSVLAVTSNGRAVRKLGGKRWKKVHRILYLAIPALLYHKGWAGKASPDQVREALVWFAPMLLLQAVRLTKFFTTKKVN